MDLQLNGKTAIVTGASRGVGLATARRLTTEGVRVVGAARTITRELEATGALTVPVDLSQPDGAQRLVDAAVAEVGGVDLLVNNAGGGDRIELGGFSSLDDDYWQYMFDLNFYAALRVTRSALPSLTERHGAVVNVSSIGGRQPGGPALPYNVAKAALNALGKGLADEVGPQGVRINTVSPGPIRTAIWESADGLGGKLAEATGVDQASLLAGLPQQMGMTIGRLIEPDEVAATIVFLLSDVAASITGAEYLVDGGLIKTT